MALPNNPQTRKEMYLSNMAGQGTALPSEPHTREEEYLDYIAKNGGGGGTGEGDMTKAVYDDDLAVASAGGIADYVAGAITGKVDKVQGKGLSTNDYDDSAKAIVDGVTTALDGKVSKSNTAGLLKNDGTVDTAILNAVSANTSAISGIKNGQSINSFADTEDALAMKAGATNFSNTDFTVITSVEQETGKTSIESVSINKADQVLENVGNAVTSGAVYSALANKVDKVAGKGLSTNDYDNTAKGIVDNIQSNVIANTKLMKDSLGWSGKNKIWADYYDGRSKTMNGITATVNSNGSITFNGTATGTFGFVIFQVSPSEFHKRFKVGDKCTILGCPANGSAFTYYLRLATDPWAILGDDYGGSKEITITDQSSKTWVKLMIGIDSGQTMNNVTFYPMICDTNILDKTFESPFSSTAFPRSEQAVLGAKNLLLYPYINTGKTESNVTIAVNSDGTVGVTIDGSASAYVDMLLHNRSTPTFVLPAGTYKLSGGVSEKIGISVGKTVSGSWSTLASSAGGDAEFTLTEETTLGVSVWISNGTTTASATIKPMIRLATDPDPRWAPYTMTNEEITEQLTPVHTEATASTGTGSGDVSLNEADYKSIVKIGKVVYFNVRFNIGTATPTSEIRLVNLGYAPDAKYPVISLRKRNAPYEEVCGVYINLSGEVTVYGKALETGDYWITGTYICK